MMRRVERREAQNNDASIQTILNKKEVFDDKIINHDKSFNDPQLDDINICGR
jgi:hypothetical protein